MIKAVHMRPDPVLPAQECALKVSILPLRLNIDQVTDRLIGNICTGLSLSLSW